jgi:hypothetical protein
MITRSLIALLLLLTTFSAYADLQNVTVNGEVRIRGRYWRHVYANAIAGPAVPRYAPAYAFGRPLGPFGTASRFDFDSRGHDLSLVEMRTRVGVLADFTGDVKAFIELESFDLWGEDFRSAYLTGADARSATTNDVEIYQSYIEVENLAALPLRLRIGRQEMKYGKGWLVDDIAAAIIGRSWDAIRLTYRNDQFTLDGWWSKLAERSPLEEDGDIDFYGLYGTYTASPALHLSAYWMLVRDARAVHDTQYGLIGEAVEYLLGLDQYDTGYLHTVGLRVVGAKGPWDYDLELAYQFGNADPAGSLFNPFTYGDTGARYGAWAGDVEVGYRPELPWKPRLFIGGAYFEGEDNRALTLGEWLLMGFHRPEASLSFNRLFPGRPYSLILGITQELSNFWQARAGATVQPFEKVSVGARLAYMAVNEPFDVPVLPFLTFVTRQADKEIGWNTFAWVRYDYSADLSLTVVWEHLFTGAGLADGNYFARNGLELVAGTDDADADYLHFDVQIRF